MVAFPPACGILDRSVHVRFSHQSCENRSGLIWWRHKCKFISRPKLQCTDTSLKHTFCHAAPLGTVRFWRWFVCSFLQCCHAGLLIFNRHTHTHISSREHIFMLTTSFHSLLQLPPQSFYFLSINSKKTLSTFSSSSVSDVESFSFVIHWAQSR